MILETDFLSGCLAHSRPILFDMDDYSAAFAFVSILEFRVSLLKIND
jgi:hypothetical protein